ncbi:MAG: hypothetical protein LRY73_11040 [Bacillus sp. (in: Bacteria)]|nr:hypothetical protein [Bacillus sp. (in: firmicutes)]
MRKITVAQHEFLKHYLNLLNEMDPVFQFAIQCYENDDVDIGGRLMKDVLAGIIPYNQENMTVYSIFGHDDKALQVIEKLQANIGIFLHSLKVDHGQNEGATLLKEKLLPVFREWKGIVERYVEGR